MAGMEQLEINSKSYIVRWVNVQAGHTISWSIQPHKKSIYFALFKHPGAGAAPNLPASGIEQRPTTSAGPSAGERTRQGSTSRSDGSTVVEKLQAIGLKLILWVGKCDADKVSMGKYPVPANEGGMYGLVFDNTFSKQASKTATFVLLTYPTNAPPQSNHLAHHFNSMAAATHTPPAGKHSPRLGSSLGSSDSLPRGEVLSQVPSQPSGSGTISGGTPTNNNAAMSADGNFHTGFLQKRRRKRHQGFAKRFFSLDFTSCTLSYYHNRQSSALRGAIPLSLAAIATNEETREISVDSGVELWHLKASNQKDFEEWRNALERASTSAVNEEPEQEVGYKSNRLSAGEFNQADRRDWEQAETLLSKVAGVRDAIRGLARDTDPKYLPSSSPGVSSPIMTPTTLLEPSSAETPREEERRPFWKRKPSTASNGTETRRSIAMHLAIPQGSGTPRSSNGSMPPPVGLFSHSDQGIHERCLSILRDLDHVVSETATLISVSKKRRPALSPAISRHSIDSTASDEFFDAEAGDVGDSNLLTIRPSSVDLERDRRGGEEEEDDFIEGEEEEDSASSTDLDRDESVDRSSMGPVNSVLFPSRPKSLTPLPLERVMRRRNVPAPTVPPPSLMGIMRKNVGKDLSNIAMPVSANEPLSLLQRTAEQMEYSELLDSAVDAEPSNGARLLYVTAFAISTISSARARERAIRKPFNPMLGETFELVREDKGYRFLAEKVSHRPVRIACQAEAKEWTFTSSPMPTQKFWGKSIEFSTDGRSRVVLHSSGACFSWASATVFLRNIIAGERYTEPVETMTVVDESSGQKALVTFKANRGMFSGRSEDVIVQAFDAQGDRLPLGLTGKWTSQLALTGDSPGGSGGETIWTAGDLVENSPSHYGLTTFAASLNEITPIEKGHVCPNDTRLRPDQRAVEQGDLEAAEDLKNRLEVAQRVRRKEMEDSETVWTPRWFVPVPVNQSGAGTSSNNNDVGGGHGHHHRNANHNHHNRHASNHGQDSPDPADEQVWRLKTGKDGYWEERARGSWDGVTRVLEY
ncbi:oxysterol binding protein [Xylona heveae TC161]|uniref:Oxysterol binding protein n=1 Tax=Xylona heveae (strain CBS 132557 / TC161) TaxID=1328760 RepID=A0A164ZV45_XYLHT|nr:oxysterol binding protein [Xylona heveae TC161]KZF19569.1 oxysterol binding protein [Xylona heveae TC161]